MTGWLREFRLIPIVLIAVGCLLALKVTGLIFDGGYTLGQRLGANGTLVVTTVPQSPSTPLRSPSTPLETASAPSSGAKRPWMREMFNYPDVTGSVDAAKPAAKESGAENSTAKDGSAAAASPQDATPSGETLIPAKQPGSTSKAERALLERLHERREQLDARARELEARDSLLKAAEKKLESQQAAERTSAAKGGPAGRGKDDGESARFKAIVTMYEAMKPKDAAKIFDRLDINVLLEVASQINPRQMAEIMAQMKPAVAERLTVELATRSGAVTSGQTVSPSSLPKIEGRPTEP